MHQSLQKDFLAYLKQQETSDYIQALRPSALAQAIEKHQKHFHWGTAQ